MSNVKSASHSLNKGSFQLRSSSQFNPKKSVVLPVKTSKKISNKVVVKPYFSKLDIDFKKVSTGLKLQKQYEKQKDDPMAKTSTNFRTWNHNPDNSGYQTSTNFFRSQQLPLMKQIVQDEKNLHVNESIQLPQRNVHTSHGFSIKEANKEYESRIKEIHASRPEKLRMSLELKEKMRDSDPFFIRRIDISDRKFEKERENGLNSSRMNYQNSDIFFSKPFDFVKDKSIDKKLLYQSHMKFYGSTNQSRSEWSPKHSNPSLLNHTNTPYNILNSSAKSISKTKKEIMESSLGSPANKQKSLCEFIDLARVFSPNPNKEYLRALNSSPKAFERSSNICANYLDLHKMYGSLCERPFVNKII